jgi:diguanylate cyclase (GGDEF)-like protein
MKNRLIKLLLIEDNPGDARLVQEMLSEIKPIPFELEWAERLSIGLNRLAIGDIDVVLLDLALPDGSGLDTLFKVRIKAPKAAIIVLTSLDDEELAIQAVREGAQDYLVKGKVNGNLLLRAISYAKQRTQAEEAIRQRNRELSTLNIIAESLSRSMRLNEVLQTALRTTLDAVGVTAGSIHLLDKDAQELVLAIQKGLNKQFTKAISRVPIGVGILGRAAETASVVMSMSTPDDNKVVPAHGMPFEAGKIQSFVSAPLKSRGKVIGVISLASRSYRDFSSGETHLLATVGDQIGVAIRNAQLVEKARKLSITDGLTGLSNRKHFHQVLDVEMSRARRTGRCFSLAVIDIDGFRHYNDTFGHTNGDKVLKSLAQTLKLSLRKIDVVFRIAGDEFAIILPATDAYRARRAVDRIRPKWIQMCEAENRILETPLSFSAGIVQFPQNAQTADSLIFLADSALYQSKQEDGHKSILVSELSELSEKILERAALK